MAERITDASGDKNIDEESLLSGTKLTIHLLKSRSGEFDLDSIFHLNLHQLDVDDLGSIGSCSCLQRLDISQNDVADLQPLAPLKQLVWLNIAANRISNLDPLQGLENLRSLNAAGNQITNFETVYGLSALQFLEDLRFHDPLQDWTNPICRGASYRLTVTSRFCHLRMLDGERMCGKGSEVFTSMRALDRALAKCCEPSSEHLTKKLPTSWVEKGFWESSAGQMKEHAVDEDAEMKLRELVRDCKLLSKSALHKIQQS